jgi:hypothetical protein
VGATAAVSVAYAPAEIGEVTLTSRTFAVAAAGRASTKTASSRTKKPRIRNFLLLVVVWPKVIAHWPTIFKRKQ